MPRWPKMTDEERFWSKADKSGDCWNWTACVSTRGYGQFSIQRKPRLAHRIAYEMSKGEIPAGMEIDHTCHNRACVKPDHLRVVTRKQNLENLTGVRINNTNGVRGVSWSEERRKWVAAVRHNGQRINLGRYDSLADAEAVVVAKRLELFTHNDLDRVA